MNHRAFPSAARERAFLARLARPRFFVQARAWLAVLLAGLGSWSQAQEATSQVVREPGGRVAPMTQIHEIRALEVDARIHDQIAEVRTSQTFHNPTSFPIEAEFVFPLPEEGVISNLTLIVDGKEMAGRLYDKDEARRVYEEIVRRRRDPALMEYLGRGLYRASVFPLAPHAESRVVFRYTQVIKSESKTMEFAYPFASVRQKSKPIQQLAIRVSIEDRAGLRSIYAPRDEIDVERENAHRARVLFERRDAEPDHDFRLVIGLGDESVGASLLSYRPSADEPGYFLVLASPRFDMGSDKTVPRTMLFVLDRSGSMAGGKLRQARQALERAIEALNDGDLFNIVVFDDAVETYKSELVRVSHRTREAAVKYLRGVREGGGTNIADALAAALAMIPGGNERPATIVFLTDGCPTTGETRELEIARQVRQANSARARLFSFGVGHDVNSRLLDRLTGGNRGTTEYVRPDEEIESRVSRFLTKMERPALADVAIELEGAETRRAYPRDLPDLFVGDQLLWVGRYEGSGPTRIRLTGKIGVRKHTFEFPAELAKPGETRGRDYVARIWASRRIGDLIDQIDMNGRNPELVDELVSLSKRFGIMTPYTSFLADETMPLQAAGLHRRVAVQELEELGQTAGASAFGQRSLKQRMLGARVDAPPAPASLGAMMGGAAMSAPATDLGRSGAGANQAETKARLPHAHAAAAEPELPAAHKPHDAIRRAGGRTLYWKNGRWVDEGLDARDSARAKRLTQFSDEYFALARALSGDELALLSLDEPAIVRIKGDVYEIQPAAPDER